MLWRFHSGERPVMAKRTEMHQREAQDETFALNKIK